MIVEIGPNKIAGRPDDLSWIDDFVRNGLEVIMGATNDDVIREHAARLLNMAFGEVKSMFELEPSNKWRVINKSGRKGIETGDLENAKEAMRPGDILQRRYTKTITEWKDVDASGTDATPEESHDNQAGGHRP
jgi:hypothetical protein